MSTSTNFSTSYEIGDGEVRLTVRIGDRQIGASAVRIDGKEVTSGIIKECIIGRGDELNGKELFVKTVVTDVNDATNRTSVTYTLSGGLRTSTYAQHTTVAADGDTVIYRATFALQGKV
jgi:hypothetical protein